MKFILTKLPLLVLLLVLLSGTSSLYAQGVTSSSMSGTVTDQNGDPLPAATVLVTHVSSGTQYGTTTRENGRFTISGMRVGGPYSIVVTFVGFQNQVRDNIYLSLGVTTNLDFVMSDTMIELGEVTVTAQRDAIFSPNRSGAATSIQRESLEMMPTISRRINDFTRLTPQSTGSSFAGQDNRFNNITVDGSYFNNSFGLAGQPGDRTGVAPIALDAIEQVQVNIAPYDVRQGNFVGAGVNTVTRSGTNELSGSAYYQFRNEDLVGTKAGDKEFDPGTFKYNQIGLRLGGPIVKNKLFFFTSFETDELTQPGTTYIANPGGVTEGGNVTRVLASDLNQLSSFLKTNFNYETGSYQGYDHEIPATRFLIRFDYNLDDRNKLSLRYTHLDSQTDVLVSNSSSLGFGSRRSSLTGLNFQNSNYIILENIRSIVGEWNSAISNNMSNNLIVGYTYNDESRDSKGTMFPFVDVLSGGSVYTSFGFEPFTPNNELRYKSFQLQNNFTYSRDDHYFTFGLSAERYESENVFFPGSQSVYVYNSLDDFYADANGYLQNPNRDTSNIQLRRFQVRWSNQPGMEKPIQPLEVFYAGLYAQDEWQVNDNLRLTIGLRADMPFFGDTGFKNDEVDGMSFKDEDGNTVKYSTSKLPDPNILFSPRLGFNWDATGDRSTQVRGGTGIFTGKPAYVWISNQIGNNGVLTGFQRLDNTYQRPFNPNPNNYKPTNVTGAPASSYELAFTDPDFRFPQLWRTNLAVDQKLPLGLVGTVEFLYNRDVNGIYYINANLSEPNTAFAGVDNRPRWTTGNKINSKIDNAIVLKNQNEGYSWNISASLEKPWSDGWFAKAAYSFGESKNTIDPGSIAFGSWNNNQHSGNPNNPGLGFSAYSPGHRVFAAVSYRKEYFNFGATTISLFWEGLAPSPDPFNAFARSASYTFSGDLNGDGGTSNDLIYIHQNTFEMNFDEYSVTVSGVTTTFTSQQQAEAWNAFIEQDDYLSQNRGKYAERGGVRLPLVFRADLSIVQEVFMDLFNKRNTLQFRLDILNIGNLLNKEWGVAERLVTTQPLIARGADSEGKALYRLRNVGNQLLSNSTEQSLTVDDVYRIQFGIRYIFN
jgi:hypothetical protein